MKKKALLIGINDYKPIGINGPDLQGCVNDVKDMANTLVICGFPADGIRILTDSRATKTNILSGLRWLIADTLAGDSIVFYYSGHGSYVTDIDGDEVDGKDEVICPHDWPEYISDDDLKAIFSGLLPGVNLEVIMDCCHSGTGTRGFISMTPGNKGQLLRPRFIPPPFDYTFYDEFKVSYKRPVKKVYTPEVVKSGEKGTIIATSMNHVLWAACKDAQLSNETMINDVTRGIFTYHFCSVIRAANGNIERTRLDILVNAAIKRYQFDQTPQLESALSQACRLIFS